MNNYDDIPKALGEIKKTIFLCAGALLIVFSLINGIYFLSKYNNATKYSSFEACYYGIKSIVENNPNKDLLNKNILKDLESLKKSFSVELLGQVKVLSPFQCDVFVKERRGTRRFQVTLEKNSKFSYFYKVLDIKERRIDMEYQVL
ncbi:MAG: hypothetical protein WD025_07940 [Bacteriovoracaceae bacterium]